MAFDGLDIEIGGSSGGAEAAISSTRRSLFGLSRGAASADDALEELGDTLTRTASKTAALGTTAAATGVSLTGLSVSGTGAAGSMTALAVSVGTATTGIIGLSAALAPLVATLGGVAAAATGLAGAFGAVVGSGLIAFGQQRAEQNREQLTQIRARIAELERLEETEEGLTAAQAKELNQLEEKADKVEETTSITGALGGVVSDLREEITPLVVALGEQFVPLIEDAIDAIPTLVENTIDALGPLEEFAAAARAFGGELLEFIPAATAALFDLAREALPVVADGLRFLRQNGSAIFAGVLRTTREVGPLLLDLGRSLASILPDLTRFGVQLLNVAIPALEGFIQTLGDVLSIQQRSSGFVDFFERLIERARTWFNSTGKQQLQTLAGDLLDGLAAALDPDGEGEGGLLTAYLDRIGSLLDSVSTWINEGGGSEQISGLVTDLYGTLATQLGQVSDEDIQTATTNLLSIFGGLFDAVITSLNSEEANSLGGQIGRIAGLTLKTLADELIAYAASDAFQEDLGGLVGAVANSVGEAILSGIVSALSFEGAQDQSFSENLDSGLSPFKRPGIGAFAVRNEEAFTTPSDTRVSEPIEINVTGDTDVVEEVTARRVEEETRDTNRRSGRGFGR